MLNKANDDIENKLKTSVNEIRDDINNAANEAGRKLRSVLNSASTEFSDASNKVTTEIRANPVISSAIALGVGVLIGTLLRSRQVK